MSGIHFQNSASVGHGRRCPPICAQPSSLARNKTRRPDGSVALQLAQDNVAQDKVVQGRASASLIRYDKGQLEPSIEIIPVADERVRHDIGNQVYRILLNAKQPVINGKWSYDFSPA